MEVATSLTILTVHQCLAAASPQCLAAASPQCLDAASPQCLEAASPKCLTAASPQCLAAASPQCLAAASPQCLAAASPQCLAAASPQCLTAASPQCLVCQLLLSLLVSPYVYSYSITPPSFCLPIVQCPPTSIFHVLQSLTFSPRGITISVLRNFSYFIT